MAQTGSHVRMHYRGTLDDGSEFDSSYARDEPICFVLGAGEALPVFEKAAAVMEVGEELDVDVPQAEAFGEYDETAIEDVPASIFGDVSKLPVGEAIAMRGEDGRVASARILAVGDDTVRLDYNHPLAGHDLHFHMELLEEERPTALEMESHAHGCSCHTVRENLEAQRK